MSDLTTDLMSWRVYQQNPATIVPTAYSGKFGFSKMYLAAAALARKYALRAPGLCSVLIEPVMFSAGCETLPNSQLAPQLDTDKKPKITR